MRPQDRVADSAPPAADSAPPGAESAPPGAGSTPPGVCPFTIARPVMRMRWERLTFLHWAYEPAVVQALLPEGLRVDTFGGAAWAGLVPFYMRVATGWPAGGVRVPWLSGFCETNVRTYARDADGRQGIWFLSLDAARLPAVVAARVTYRLPYFWSVMRLAARDREVAYACRREWPGPRPATSRVRVSVGDPVPASGLGDLGHFLTARWILFSVTGSRQRFARACHQPWPLHHATVRDLDDRLLTAAGLPAPHGEPLVHYSPGVDVRIGRPER
jgi:uncharacterized protein YqjF (DUF2071 family)